MKLMFLFASALCAVALSVLGIVLAGQSGRVQAAQDIDRQTPEPAAETGHILSLEDSVVEDLKNGLETQRAAYEKKMAALETREKELEHQQSLMKELKSELEDLQRQLDETVVKLESNEETRFRLLATIYGKMEPENASSLLLDMEPKRSAAILSLMGDRQAAGVLAATVGKGADGTRTAAMWSDIIRTMQTAAK